MEGAKGLPDRETCNRKVILAASRDRIPCNLVVQAGSILAGVGIVLVEEWRKVFFIKIVGPE